MEQRRHTNGGKEREKMNILYKSDEDADEYGDEDADLVVASGEIGRAHV